jgi:hypothetical protein
MEEKNERKVWAGNADDCYCLGMVEKNEGKV